MTLSRASNYMVNSIVRVSKDYPRLCSRQ